MSVLTPLTSESRCAILGAMLKVATSVGVLLAVCLGLILVTGSSNESGSGSALTPPAQASNFGGSQAFERCRPGPQGGGHDVWAFGVECKEVRKQLRELSGAGRVTSLSKRAFMREVGEWTCLGQQFERQDTIYYACHSEDRAIVFQFS